MSSQIPPPEILEWDKLCPILTMTWGEWYEVDDPERIYLQAYKEPFSLATGCLHLCWSATVQSQLHTQLQLPARTHPGRWKICTELWAPSFGSAPLQPLQTCGEWARGWTCSYILSFPNYQTYKWNNSRKQKKAVACYAQDLLEWGYENPRVWH